MKRVRGATLSFLFLLGLIPALKGQFVVTYPGLQASDPTVAIYNTTTGLSVNYFSSLPSYPPPSPGATGAFKFLSTSTGNLHFYIANTAGAAGTYTGTFYRSQTHFGDFTTPVTSALISPDDQYLVIGESTVHFFFVPPFSSGSSTDLTPGGLAIPNATNVLDLAVDYDSQTIFVLSTDGTLSYLSTISLAPLALGQTPTVAQTIPVPNGSTFITFAPNGLLYISSPLTITELNPVTLTATTGGVIPVTLNNPGRPVFTPGGQYLVAADTAPVAGGSAAVLVDLPSHTSVGALAFNGLVSPISELFAISDSTVYAFIRGQTTLWALQIGSNGGLIASVPPFAANLATAGSSTTNVAAFGASDNVGAPGRDAPQYVFLADNSNSYLYIIDPVSLAVLSQIFLGDSFSPPGEIGYFVPSAGVAPSYTLTYGNNQTIPLGGMTIPLVIRTVDVNGYPSAGNYITFYLPEPPDGITFDGVLSPVTVGAVGNTTVITGADGYAEVFYTAGTQTINLGPVSIGTTTPDNAAFNVTVGSAIPATATTLNIVSGQGQVVFQSPGMAAPQSPQPFVVEALDSFGNPLPNVPIVFTTLSTDPNAGPGPSVTTMTDSMGQASTYAYGAFAPPFPNFVTELVTATTGTLTATFYLTTIADVAAPPTGCLVTPCPTVVPEISVTVVKPNAGSALSGNAGSTIAGAVQVVVGSLPNAIPIPNVGVSVNTGTSTTVPNVRCSEPTGSGVILTDANGVANCDLILNNIGGTEPLAVYIGGVAFDPSFASITVTPNPAATMMVVSGNNQYGDTGTPLPTQFTVQAIDASGNPIPTTPITWQVTSGSVTLNPVATVTDDTGSATATGVLGTTPGVATVTATAGSATATFTVNVVTPAGDVLVVSGNGQTAQNQTAFAQPLVVQVIDNNGNPATFGAVTFTAPGAPYATIVGAPAGSNSLTVTTDSNGQASVMVMGGSPGLVKINVESTDTVASTSFSLTVLSPAPSSILALNAASFTTTISPGALISVTGATLTPTIQGVITDPAAIQSSGYTLNIGGYNAPILALVNENGIQQINAQLPFEDVAGATTMAVQTPQGTTTVNVTIAAFAPAVFTSGTVTVNGSAFPEAVALRPDGSYVSSSNPALAGETITVFATGLGQTTPNASDGSTGAPGQTVYAPLYLAINHLSVTVASALYQIGTAGVYAISVQIPATATTGPGQPLSLFVQDSTGANYNAPDVYIPISQ